VVVSAIGFYVATLGMKATQENTLRLANAYFVGTVVAGIAWNAFNIFGYVMFYKDESEPTDDDEVPPLTRDDFVTIAFFTVAMPFMVWGLCWARAFEFRRLIEEAEIEAAERIRGQLSAHDQQQQRDNDSGRQRRTRSSVARGASVVDQELEDLSSSSNDQRRPPPEIV
jgi:hypothetical protein